MDNVGVQYKKKLWIIETKDTEWEEKLQCLETHNEEQTIKKASTIKISLRNIPWILNLLHYHQQEAGSNWAEEFHQLTWTDLPTPGIQFS